MSGFFKKFRRDVVGVVWLAVGLFIGLALLSFRPTDPSFNSTGVNLVVHNYCGYIGSFVADIFYQVWGFGAWVLIAACLRISFRTFKGDKTPIIGPRLILGGLLLITVSSLLALYFPQVRYFSGQIPIGGLVGTVVSRGLVSAFNFLGVSIILWSFALLLLVFYTERSLQEIFKSPLGWAGALREAISAKGSMFRQLFDFSNMGPATAGAGVGGSGRAPRVRAENGSESVDKSGEKVEKSKKGILALALGKKSKSEDAAVDAKADAKAEKKAKKEAKAGAKDSADDLSDVDYDEDDSKKKKKVNLQASRFRRRCSVS